MGFRHAIRELLPPVALEALDVALRRPRFSGDYDSFEKALAASRSYNNPEIAAAFASQQAPTTARLTSRVQQLLAALAPVIAKRDRLSVLDVGGANGYYYHALQPYLPPLEWTILETPEMARACANGVIHYATDVAELKPTFDVVLLSGVIQYLPDPYAALASFSRLAPYLILNRLPLIERDWLTVQIVRTAAYTTSYPAWFLSESKMLSALGTPLMRWDVPEDAPVFNHRRVTYQGMLVHTH